MELQRERCRRATAIQCTRCTSTIRLKAIIGIPWVHAIPDNGNLANGLMFNAEKTYSGDELSREYAEMRMRFERLYEVTRIKGEGVAHPSLSPDGEFADFETLDKGNLNLTPKKPGMIQYEYAREAYKNGLKLKQQLGVDPFTFGLVAGSDISTLR